MTVNVLEAVRAEAPEAAVVLAGSGEVYGRRASLPVDEDGGASPPEPVRGVEGGGRPAGRAVRGRPRPARGPRCAPSTTPGPGQSDLYVVGALRARWPRPRRRVCPRW